MSTAHCQSPSPAEVRYCRPKSSLVGDRVLTSAWSRRSSLLGSCCHRRRNHQLSQSRDLRRGHHHHRVSTAAAGSPVNRRLLAVAVVQPSTMFIVGGWPPTPTPLAYVTADGSRCRNTYRSAIAEARRESAAVAYQSQCCMITESRRRHTVKKTPYQRAVESARWRAIRGAHRWQAAGSDRRCVVDESRHRPANVGHGRRPVAVVCRVVPGRPVGRQGHGVV